MSEQDQKPLGKTQALRREVRFYMASHLMKNEGSFLSYMSTSAVMWLLGGREGVSPQDRVALVEKAHLYIAKLHQTVGNDPDVTLAHSACDSLLAIARTRLIEATENQPKPGDVSVDEFMDWMGKEFPDGVTEEPQEGKD